MKINISALSIALQAILQLFSICMVPLSKGFTEPLPTVACIGGFALALFLLARMQQTGANLSVLVPLLAAMVPLASVIMMLVLFDEHASVVRIALLVGACGLIGAAARFA